MRVVRHLARLPAKLEAAVLTLGNFDGVHLGHQAIISRAVARARELGGQAVALTFEPHPLAVLAPARAPALLQTLHDRLVLMRELGIDVAVLQRFTLRFARLAPEEFVEDFLLRYLDLRHVVVGYNVSFGRNRAGTGDTLRALGARHGFAVDVVGPVRAPGDPENEHVSSTRLRDVIARGDLTAARRLLGRPYALRGRVVVGDRRGRTLGFPTANLHVRPGLLLPPDGVYAVIVDAAGGRHAGVLNIGMRPTFAGRRRTIEAHLLDFDGDLYRQWLVVRFVARLRGEMTFAGPDALRAAIAADVAQARRVLAADDGSRSSS
jgi:riboflavin kinase/FMN adenylyltransferase